MLRFVKIVRIEYFSIKTNTKQAKFSCFKALLFVGIKNLHLLTKFRHFRVSIKQVFLPTYNAKPTTCNALIRPANTIITVPYGFKFVATPG